MTDCFLPKIAEKAKGLLPLHLRLIDGKGKLSKRTSPSNSCTSPSLSNTLSLPIFLNKKMVGKGNKIRLQNYLKVKLIGTSSVQCRDRQTNQRGNKQECNPRRMCVVA